MKADISDAMSREWDSRVAQNNFFGNNQNNKVDRSWFESGRRDASLFVEGLFASPDRTTMLEIGCGVGRMTGAFADMFKTVYAIDVSAEMVSSARQNVKNKNVNFSKSNGINLNGIGSNSIDFIFSYKVFQHLPDEAILEKYASEMYRVLRSGGLAKFQMRSRRRYYLPKSISKLLFRLKGNKLKASNTYLGITISKNGMASTLEKAGLEVVKTEQDPSGEKSIDYLITAKKP